MAIASIDIEQMGALVSAIERACQDLPARKCALVAICDGVGVDGTPAAGVDKVVTWADEQLVGLRRRLALAVAIEEARPGGSAPRWCGSTSRSSARSPRNRPGNGPSS